MRTREKKLSDCGTSPGRAKELMALARQEQNTDFLVKSLTEEVGYWSICSWVYIPATKADFYGYRRKTLAAFDNLLKKRGNGHGCQTHRQTEKEDHS